MFTVIGLMLGGMAIGFLLRRQEFSWINKVITSLIWVLLFLLGVEVGGNRQIVEGLATLGVEAFTITLACVLGSCIFAWGLWYVQCRPKYRKRSTDLEKFPFAESKTDLPACCYYTGNHIGSCTGEPHSSPPECRRLYGSWFGLWLLFTIQHLHYAI